MKIKVYQDRYLIEDKDISASQYENLATTLFFEFPEFVDKNGENIETNKLNKYIVFDIDDEENQDIILDNKYSFPYEITKREEITFYIKLQEESLSEDMSDKLIWISKGITISFNKTKDGKTNISNEKLDAFNTAVSTLNQKTTEVNLTIKDVESKVENGEFDGENGLTPYIQDKMWHIGGLNTGIRAEAISIKSIKKTNTIDNIDEYTIYFSDTTNFKYEVINGKDYIITDTDKKEMTENVKNDIQPILDEIEKRADDAVSIAKGANQSLVYNNYSEMISAFNLSERNSYKSGQNVLIVTLNVPDLWISEVVDENVQYTYTSDENLINIIKENGSVQIGFYKLSALETQKVDLTEYIKEKDLQNEVLDFTYSKEQIDEQIGDISSILDSINGEVI